MPRIGLRTPLDLDATLHSGQAFRWLPQGEGWQEGFIRNRIVRFRVRDAAFEWTGDASTADVLRYFRLDASHERFLAEVRRDASLDRSLAAFPGLRLLAQDPWEVFVAFILSANSNVGKIRRTIEALARLGADDADPMARPPFPTPDAIAALSERDLRTTSMGYRAPHVRGAAQRVADADLDLDALRNLPYEDAHKVLVETPGVGDKVADCIQLYGLEHFGAFPVDVWIHRVVREQYHPRKRLNHGAMGAWARDHFGPWAGYAQHYLFHYRRVVGPWPRVASNQRNRRRVAAVAASSRAALALGTGGNATPA